MTQTYDDKFYLNRIIDDLSTLEKYFCSPEEFFRNKILSLGLIKCAENVGEGCKKLSPGIKAKTTEIRWGTLQYARDVSVHEYYKYDYSKGWRQLSRMLKSLPEFRKLYSSEFSTETLTDSTAF